MTRTLRAIICVLPLLLALGAGTTACSGNDSSADEVTTDGDEAPDREDADGQDGDGGEGDDEEAAVPVEIVELERGPIEAVLRYSTNLEAEEQVGVYAQASRQVRTLNVEEGDRARKGQVLLRLVDEEQRTRVAKVRSQLERARREFDRQKRLFSDDLISEQAFNDATYELNQLELELEDAQRELSYTEVVAPIGGTITRRLVNLGDTVTLNQRLFEMVDFDSIVARVYVPEKELKRLEQGQPARLVAPALGADRMFRGSIDRLSPVVDPQSGTVKVTVAIPRQEGLRPGMYVDVQLVTDVHEDAVLVPKRAVVYDDDQIFVYRVDPDSGTAERVYLTAKLEDERHIEPVDGLAAGEQVVVAGQAGLKDGARVRLAGAETPLGSDPVADAGEETAGGAEAEGDEAADDEAEAAE